MGHWFFPDRYQTTPSVGEACIYYSGRGLAVEPAERCTIVKVCGRPRYVRIQWLDAQYGMDIKGDGLRVLYPLTERNCEVLKMNQEVYALCRAIRFCEGVGTRLREAVKLSAEERELLCAIRKFMSHANKREEEEHER